MNEMICAQCKKEITGIMISAADHYFCSDVCHLRFWKEEMPNLGGRWISDEHIKKAEELEGQERRDFYNKIVMAIVNNFDQTYFMLLLSHSKDPNELNS